MPWCRRQSRLRQLICERTRLHPELPILLVSGLGERALDSTGRVDAVLPKPFRQQELADALHRAVRAHGLSAAAQTSV